MFYYCNFLLKDSVSGYDSIGGPNLIGNLLEEIKPEVDTGPLSHFDQIYAAEVTSAADPQRGIGKNTIFDEMYNSF